MAQRTIQGGLGYADTTGKYVSSDALTMLAGTYGAGINIGDTIDTAGRSCLRMTLTSSANSGTTPTADVAIQTSACGQTWRTIHSFAQIGTSALSAVTSDGTTPPTITVSGTPVFPCGTTVKVKCTGAGARGTWTGSASYDNGGTYEFSFTSGATVTLLAPNGTSTGIVLAIGTGNAATDNTWTFSITSPQRVSLGGLDRFTRAVCTIGGSSTPTETILLEGEVLD